MTCQLGTWDKLPLRFGGTFGHVGAASILPSKMTRLETCFQKLRVAGAAPASFIFSPPWLKAVSGRSKVHHGAPCCWGLRITLRSGSARTQVLLQDAHQAAVWPVRGPQPAPAASRFPRNAPSASPGYVLAQAAPTDGFSV